MIEGKKNVLEYYATLTPTLEGEEFVYWIINSGHVKDGKPINTSGFEDGLTRAEARAKLEQQVALLHCGDYTLTCQAKTNGKVKRGDKEIKFRIPLNDNYNNNTAQIAGVQTTTNVGLSKDEAERIADERFEKQMLKYKAAEQEKRIADLEKQNKEYEAESNGMTNKIISMIAGVVEPMLKAKAAPQVMPAIGTLHEQTTDEQTEALQRSAKLQEVLEKTEQLFEQDAVDYLHKLITYLEANKSFISIIKMQVP